MLNKNRVIKNLKEHIMSEHGNLGTYNNPYPYESYEFLKSIGHWESGFVEIDNEVYLVAEGLEYPLPSSIGTGTGTGTGSQVQRFIINQNLHGDLFSQGDISWDISGSVQCTVEVKDGQIISVDTNFSYSFSGGNSMGNYGDYTNLSFQGNTFTGSTAGVYSNVSQQIKDNYYDFYNSVSTASATLHGIGFSIDGSGFDELGNPVFVPYWNDTKDIELSCRATYDPYHNTISIEPTITAN